MTLFFVPKSGCPVFAIQALLDMTFENNPGHFHSHYYLPKPLPAFHSIPSSTKSDTESEVTFAEVLTIVGPSKIKSATALHFSSPTVTDLPTKEL